MVAADVLPLDPHALRADFPILETKVHGKPLIYFDSAASTQRPRHVIEAMEKMATTAYANVHRGVHALAQAADDLYDAARRKVQTFLGAASSDEIVFTSGATAAINLVARSWGDVNVTAGDEILVTEMEHHSNLVPWQQLAERTGCKIRAIPIADDGLLRLESLDELLSERTKLVAITSVSNVLGTINPLTQIVDKAHAAGAVVLVDGAQSVPHSETNVQATGVDFLAFSGHKMCGPTGVGVLFGKEKLLDAMPPFLGGGSMITRVEIDRFTPAGLPAKFEAGTPPIVQAVGLGAAIDYLSAVGLHRIAAHERLLVERAHRVLTQQGDVRLLGPAPEHKAGIVSFVVEGIQTNDLAISFDLRGIAIRNGHHCAMPLHERLGIAASDRASFYLYNTLEEVDQLEDALAAARKMFRR
ncbi:MAG: SufS family cysteine desulfurase [Planctomycetales bacterium]|nr:SufS family cysteine desulfurase [Planctomycetales bacterium]